MQGDVPIVSVRGDASGAGRRDGDGGASADGATERHRPSVTAGYFRTREKLLTRRGVLWLGQTCNIRCHFCYFLDRIENKEHPEHQFMELEKAKAICHTLRYKYGNT